VALYDLNQSGFGQNSTGTGTAENIIEFLLIPPLNYLFCSGMRKIVPKKAIPEKMHVR
jgi:hypothetical protein